MSRSLLLLGTLTAALVVASCGDPVHDNEVAALGGETPGVAPGPTHRPGQPCLVCHGGNGPASTVFALGGTVYEVPTTTIGYSGVTVQATDVNKSVGTATTNSVGNFYILQSAYAPTYPVDIQLAADGVTNQMLTHIGRNGSCAICHFDPPGPATPGHVYFAGDVADLPDGGGQ